MIQPSRPPTLESEFEQLAGGVPATIGIAVAGPRLAEVFSLGSWPGGVAWSTIKVPLAIAALRRDHSLAKDLVVEAITESDNPSSERLWCQLGEPVDAARQVQAIISEAGDTGTVVESRRLRQGFTAFGQTQWTLGRQARFAAGLPYIGDASTVIDLMRRLTTEQCWGLAAKGVAAKGGWGPGVHGGYLVRQFGIMPQDSGPVGVALAAEANAFETGVDVLNTMTEWLISHLPALTEQ
ncbi:MAG: hypothetical protein ACLPLP_19440 [Mycobacterium sp.]